MPPRKSDQGASRKSDVSTTRFVLAPESEAHIADKPLPSLATSESVPAAPPSPSQDAAALGAGPAAADASFMSTASGAPTEGGVKDGGKKKEDKSDKDAVAIEDLNLPKSIITRLAKGVLPPNTQIQGNAILAMTKSASVFVSHLASAANELTIASNKKTIMPQDVFAALDEIEFGFMRPQLEAEFAKFNQIQTSKRSTYRKKVAAAKRGPDGDGDTTLADASALSADATGVQADVSTHGENSMLSTSAGGAGDPASQQQRAAKKARTEGGMDIDGGGEPSDAETEPEEEHVDDEDEEDDDVDEEEDDEEEVGAGGREDEEGDALEEREEGPDEDEALGGNESD